MPMNQSGCVTTVVACCNTFGSRRPANCAAVAIGSQIARRTITGFSRRQVRVAANSTNPDPRRSNASSVTRFEKPPTKKKTGMTWKTHVSSHALSK